MPGNLCGQTSEHLIFLANNTGNVHFSWSLRKLSYTGKPLPLKSHDFGKMISCVYVFLAKKEKFFYYYYNYVRNNFLLMICIADQSWLGLGLMIVNEPHISYRHYCKYPAPRITSLNYKTNLSSRAPWNTNNFSSC